MQIGAECSGEPGDCLACGLVADAVGQPGAGNACTCDVGRGADGGQAFLDLGKGGPGGCREAQSGQVGAVDDVDVEMDVDRQAGLVLLAEAPLGRWLQRPRVWFVTVVLNSRIMTWFLWHLTSMVGVAALLVALGGFGLGLEPLSPVWWLTRPLWWLVLLAVTYGLVLVFGRFESPQADNRPAPATWRPICAAGCVCAGLAVLATAGMVGPHGVNWLWPLLPVVGLAVFGVLLPPRRKSV